MQRKDFLKSCGFSCLGAGVMTALLPGCATTKITGGTITGDDLVVPISDFETKAGNEKHYKKYVVVQNDLLKYPVCIYRFNDREYAALWMRCTHQGAELQVFGDKLQCPAHGSEFTNKGLAQNGPADVPLRTFQVTVEQHHIKISLKAV
jgi:Rieske Fe-S protein